MIDPDKLTALVRDVVDDLTVHCDTTLACSAEPVLATEHSIIARWTGWILWTSDLPQCSFLPGCTIPTGILFEQKLLRLTWRDPKARLALSEEFDWCEWMRESNDVQEYVLWDDPRFDDALMDAVLERVDEQDQAERLVEYHETPDLIDYSLYPARLRSHLRKWVGALQLELSAEAA